MSGKALFILLASAMLIVGACIAQDISGGSVSSVAGDEVDIVDTIIARGNFNTLVTAIQEAGLTDTLKGPGPFTVFAPTDEAFARIPQANLDALLNNTTELTDVLMYHIARGELTSENLIGQDSLETMGGQNLTITANGNVMVNNANVIEADIEATNGVVHVVDAVLTPAQVIET